jgi:hypothetical protein
MTNKHIGSTLDSLFRETGDLEEVRRLAHTKMKTMKLADINLLAIGNTIPLTGAIYQGEGKTYLAFFPGESLTNGDKTTEVIPLEMDPGEWETFLRQTDLQETEMLTKAKDGTVTKAIVRKCERNIAQTVSWKVFKRDGYACRYCAADDTPLTVDHLVLWEEGGPSTEANLVAACKKCNKTRGNTQYADWLRHPHYLRVSANLSEHTQLANIELIAKLDKIPKLVHARSR